LEFAIVCDEKTKEQDEIVTVLPYRTGGALKNGSDVTEKFFKPLKCIDRLLTLTCHTFKLPRFYFSKLAVQV
jgi:hypothetical protein